MAKDTIKCEICGAETHTIPSHLQKVHGEASMEPMTLEEYKSKYPGKPVYSATALQRIEDKQRDKSLAKVGVKGTGKTGSLHELFKLGKNKSAVKADGSPIPVSVCQQETYPELVPELNSGYVYDMENLKSCLACIEMNKPIYAFGYAGLGKSTIFKQICAATNRRYIRFQHNQDSQVSEAVGQWVVNKHVDVNGNAVSVTEWQLGPLAMAMLHGWLYNADELDRAPPGFNSVYQAALEGEPLVIGDAPEEFRIIKAHPDFRIVATGNTNGSGDETGLFAATMQQDAAGMERYQVIEISYLNAKEEIALLKAATPLNDKQATAVVKFATKVRDRFPEDFDLTMGPRVLINIGQMSMARGSFAKGIELAYSNRLPADQRKSANDVAQRIFGEV
jgi:cobaltochelatase CobS